MLDAYVKQSGEETAKRARLQGQRLLPHGKSISQAVDTMKGQRNAKTDKPGGELAADPHGLALRTGKVR